MWQWECLPSVLQARPVSPGQAHRCCSLGFVTPFKAKVQSSVLVCWQSGCGKVSVLLLEQVHSRLLHPGGLWDRQQCHLPPRKCSGLDTGAMADITRIAHLHPAPQGSGCRHPGNGLDETRTFQEPEPEPSHLCAVRRVCG